MIEVDIEKLKELRSQGVKREEIAKILGIQPHTISALAKKHNLPRPAKSPEMLKKLSEAQKRVMAEDPKRLTRHLRTPESQAKAAEARRNSEIWHQNTNSPEAIKKGMMTKIERYGNADGVYLSKEGGFMAYRGSFKTFNNPSKYVGNIENVTYRSLWEKSVMQWLDENPNVKEWASEEIFFRYEHPVTGKSARYFPDFYVKMADDVVRIIEVKPAHQVTRPKEPKRKTKKYINEIATWLINQEKWKEARYHCSRNEMNFEIWTEDTLQEMGIHDQKRLPTLQEKVSNKKKPVHKKTTRPKRPRPTRRS